jgi:NAD-specific glutamate dehydrogenase
MSLIPIPFASEYRDSILILSTLYPSKTNFYIPNQSYLEREGQLSYRTERKEKVEDIPTPSHPSSEAMVLSYR